MNGSRFVKVGCDRVYLGDESLERNRYIRKSRTSSVLFFLYFFLLLSFQSPDSCKKGEKSRFFDTGKLCSSFVLRLIKPACVGRGGALV